jgi:glutathione S-transferase/translation elongation factor EF-1beta
MTKLYTNRLDHFFFYTPRITAAFVGTNVEVVVATQEQQDSVDFKAKKAHGKFPFLELEDGTIIFESNAIAAYFARAAGNQAFLGTTPFAEAEVEQWTLIAASGNWPHSYKIAYNVFGHVYNTEEFNNAVKGIKEQVKILNTHLEGKQYLVGDSITLADVSQFVSLIVPFSFVLDGGFRKAMPNVSAWFQRVSQEQAVKSVAGNVKMCEKSIKPVDPTKLVAVEVKPVPTPTLTPAPAKKADDDFDPFADDGEDDSAAQEALKQKAAESKDKKVKAAPIAKSIIVWEVKPWGEETDLDALAAKIIGITMDGLVWKTEYKKEPIAYGVFKIIIGAVVEDAKVSTDLVEETIMAFEDEV